MRHLRVRNWDTYQHYHDRKPTWIKLYVELHEKWEYMSLPDAAKAHVCGIFLLAARIGNRLPADAGFIGQQIGATEPVDLELLMAPGREFLEYVDEDGSRETDEGQAQHLADPSGSAPELLAGPERKRPVSGTDTKRKREQREREQITHPQTPAPETGAGALKPAEAARAADRLAAYYRELLGTEVHDRQARLWAKQLRRGTPEDALRVEIERWADQKRTQDQATADERARFAAAEAWVSGHGGRQLVARSALECCERSRGPDETIDQALKRWADEGGVPREVLTVCIQELYQLQRDGRGERSPPQPRARGAA